MTKLIFGCGYLGTRAAALWKSAGHMVRVVTRSEEKAGHFAAEGYEAVIADVTQAESLAAAELWREVDTVLFAVGFDRASGKTIDEVYARGTANVLGQLPAAVARLIYISSTGVYGASGGEWIDEETPCCPQRDGGKACLAAEEVIRGSAAAARSIILRFGGIYGPLRLPRVQDLVAGRTIPAAEEGWLNLIHVDDGAHVVLDVEARAKPPALYVVTDGHPVTRRDFYRQAAKLLGSPSPRFEVPAADVAAASRGGSDKRVKSDKLQTEIAPRLKHPTFREGLVSILTNDAKE